MPASGLRIDTRGLHPPRRLEEAEVLELLERRPPMRVGPRRDQPTRRRWINDQIRAVYADACAACETCPHLTIISCGKGGCTKLPGPISHQALKRAVASNGCPIGRHPTNDQEQDHGIV